MRASDHQSLGFAMDDYWLNLIFFGTMALSGASVVAAAWMILRDWAILRDWTILRK